GGEEEERPFGGVFPDQDVAAPNMRRLSKRKQLFPVRMTPARDDQQLSALFAPGCRPNERGDAIGCGLHHGPPGLFTGLSKSACYRRHSPATLTIRLLWERDKAPAGTLGRREARGREHLYPAGRLLSHRDAAAAQRSAPRECARRSQRIRHSHFASGLDPALRS